MVTNAYIARCSDVLSHQPDTLGVYEVKHLGTIHVSSKCEP